MDPYWFHVAEGLRFLSTVVLVFVRLVQSETDLGGLGRLCRAFDRSFIEASLVVTSKGSDRNTGEGGEGEEGLTS